jgi:hypothetical protein
VHRRTLSLIAAGALVVGCSSGGSGSSAAPAAAGAPGGAEPSMAAGIGGGTGGVPGGRQPSGARVRIVNAYAPLDGEPGPIDIYASPWAGEGDTPLLSVPYGTASPFFDPTVSDDAGDMALSAYWAGTQGNGNELISQSETLKGGEVITFIVTTGSSSQASGRPYGQIQAFFAKANGGTFGQATPEPGKALLVVDTVGIDNVLPSTNGSTWYLGIGDGCTKTIGDSDDTLTAAGPGSAGTYQLDPGSYKGSIYSEASDFNGLPTCDGSPLVGNVDVQAVADQTTILLVYAPKDGDIRTLVVPLDE